MAIQIVNIASSRNTIFVESNNVVINDGVIENQNDLDSIRNNNNTSDNFAYIQRGNNSLYSLHFAYNSFVIDEEVTTVRQQEEVKRELGHVENIKPFFETKEKFIRKKACFVRKSIGSLRAFDGDPTYLKKSNRPFYDKVNPIHARNFLLEDLDDPDFEYHFTFNYSDFYFRGGRIDAFSRINKIKMAEDSIDQLRGFKFNSFGKSKSPFGLNNTINQFYKKEDTGFFAYNDNIDDVYLVNNTFKKVISSINYTYDADTNKFTETTSMTFKPVYSSEARFFDFQESLLPPFRERTQNENYNWINSNIYKFTNNDINTKILSNKSKNDDIIEDIIYASHGRDINKEYSAGRDSIGFYESID